jgi:flavin-dependent dehydrogenase
MKKVNSVLVVGGGTAGLVAAIILKKHLNIKVDVVYSKNIGIIGVGEGSTEHFKQFMDFVNINQYDLIKNCDATYKSGIMFEGWNQDNYLHCVSGNFNKKTAQYHYVYAKQIAEKSSYMNSSLLWENKMNLEYVNKSNVFPFNQFHFNTHKLNEYLINIARDLGISGFDDEIHDVILNDQGEIDSLKGNAQTYSYDFYLDATGFKRILMNKLGAKWNSYSKYLKMNSAVVFPTEDEDNYNVWTLAKAMDYGWMFKIPVWGRHGNGYIFDSNYISIDEAKKEVETLFGKKINFGKEFKFDPGALESVWIKNCCAVGLSGSFVEPLEATSIGTTIQQSFLLMHKLMNYDEKTIQKYNHSFNEIMENIRDFIVLHYITKKENTQFWKDVSRIELPDTLHSKLEIWKNKLPIADDFSGESNYTLFNSANYILVMHGLGLFDSNAIINEYNALQDFVKHDANNTIANSLYYDKNSKTITHKEFISLIRNYL